MKCWTYDWVFEVEYVGGAKPFAKFVSAINFSFPFALNTTSLEICFEMLFSLGLIVVHKYPSHQKIAQIAGYRLVEKISSKGSFLYETLSFFRRFFKFLLFPEPIYRCRSFFVSVGATQSRNSAEKLPRKTSPKNVKLRNLLNSNL